MGLHYEVPDARVAANPQVELRKLWRRNLWPWHVGIHYQERVDAIFYPGVEWFDLAGMKVRRWLRRRVPVIATLEGLVGDEQTEQRLTDVAGHPVRCHRVGAEVLRRARTVLDSSDHIIAISPFLARMGRVLYGDKVSHLPLGVDLGTFHPPPTPRLDRRPVVVSAGHVAEHKRPELFVEMARRFPEARFKWFGEGTDRSRLINEAAELRLLNIEFPGAKRQPELAEEFRKSDIFVLLSLSEGVPKVTQEAAACGLPVIAFRQYEPPTVVDEQTGFLVSDDRDVELRLGQLIDDAVLRRSLGMRAQELARDWDWGDIAKRWEQQVSQLVRSAR